MRSSHDEIMVTGIKRQFDPPRIVGNLLQSEIAEKQARSIKYQLTVTKLPLAKNLKDFDFADTPVNEGLVLLASQCRTGLSKAAIAGCATNALMSTCSPAKMPIGRKKNKLEQGKPKSADSLGSRSSPD